MYTCSDCTHYHPDKGCPEMGTCNNQGRIEGNSVICDAFIKRFV